MKNNEISDRRCNLKTSGNVWCKFTYLLFGKIISDLRQVGGFLWVLQFPLPIKMATMI